MAHPCRIVVPGAVLGWGDPRPHGRQYVWPRLSRLLFEDEYQRLCEEKGRE
jgi:hypothetical protein